MKASAASTAADESPLAADVSESESESESESFFFSLFLFFFRNLESECL